MVKINLVSGNNYSVTRERLIALGRECDVEFINYRRTPDNTDFTVFKGYDDEYDLSKSEELTFLSDIIPNTKIVGFDDLDNMTTVVLKNPTRLVLYRDVDFDEEEDMVLKYIPNRIEWRVNYSYGKVNGIYNKNITPTTIFGKSDITQWSYERDNAKRKYLIDVTKKIGAKVSSLYPKVQSFGLDIIYDLTYNKYYLLELNRANSLNDEQCRFFIQSILDHMRSIRSNAHLSINTCSNPSSPHFESLSRIALMQQIHNKLDSILAETSEEQLRIYLNEIDNEF